MAETLKYRLWKTTWYETPPVPPLKSIRGSNLKPKDQVYTRHTEYLRWRWNDDPKKGYLWWERPEPGQLEWYNAEVKRIMQGEWVMIEGKPVFLNLFAYFYFQWFVTKEGFYPTYKDSCLMFMYFMEHVFFTNRRCRGGNTMKGRRKHVSTMCMSIMLQFGLIKENTEQGITSKSGRDAEKIFKLMLVNGYSRLPNFLKPRISGTDDPKTTLHITSQPGKITKLQPTGTSKDGLNNRIEWRALTSNVFDGDGLWFLLLDECGKWPTEVPIDEYLEIASNIITAGQEMGRIVCITTVNRDDRGGAQYKKVWYDSDQNETDELGQTGNKLLQYFIPGYMGGRDLGWVDKYGNSVWDTPTPEQTEWLRKDPNTLDPTMGCKAYCELQRRLKADDPEKLQEEIRMFPFTPEEVFRGANNACYFNIRELNDQTERIDAKLGYASLYRKGWFKANADGDAYFVDAPTGTPNENAEFIWYFLELPEKEEANRYTWSGGHRTPTNTDYGVAGADLVNNTEKTAEKGSDAAVCIFKRYNALDPENSGMIVGLGIGRPSSIAFMHEQLFLSLRYFGIKALIERSPITWYDYALEKKLLGYCVKTNLKMTGEERYGISVQDGEAREQHLTEMIEYASVNMAKVWFKRVLKDMEGFSVKDRTVFDACMAFGYALMALKDKHRQSVHDLDEEKMYRLYDLNARYGRRRVS